MRHGPCLQGDYGRGEEMGLDKIFQINPETEVHRSSVIQARHTSVTKPKSDFGQIT